tara:strand:- start:619 stop:1080 length:462 start_codon:yes stop_codon:yes gene_type:complete
MSNIKVKKITAANWQAGTHAVYEVVGYEGFTFTQEQRYRSMKTRWVAEYAEWNYRTFADTRAELLRKIEDHISEEKQRNTEYLQSLADTLSEDDLVELLNMVSDKLFIFVERHQPRLVEVDFACRNGDSVQINILERAEEERITLPTEGEPYV